MEPKITLVAFRTILSDALAKHEAFHIRNHDESEHGDTFWPMLQTKSDWINCFMDYAKHVYGTVDE
jgi:hypothetical protein